MPRQKEQDVPRGFDQVDLHHCHQGGVQVVGLGLLRVKDLHGKGSARDPEDVAVEEVLGELLSVEGGWRDDESEVISFLHHVLHDAEEHIRMDGPLVGLVQHDARIVAHVLIDQRFSKEHTISHVLDLGGVRGAVLESDGVADLLSQDAASFFSHSLGDTHGGHPTRLGAPDDLAFADEPGLQKVLGHLRRLTRPGLPYHDQELVSLDDFDELVLEGVDGEGLPLFFDGHLRPRLEGVGVRFLEGLLFPFGDLILGPFSHGRPTGLVLWIGVLPVFGGFTWVGVSLGSLLLLFHISALLSELKGLERLSLKSALWVFDHLDRGQVDARFGRLASQERRFRLVEFNFHVIFY